VAWELENVLWRKTVMVQIKLQRVISMVLMTATPQGWPNAS